MLYLPDLEDAAFLFIANCRIIVLYSRCVTTKPDTGINPRKGKENGMFREMRRKKNEISIDMAKQLLASSRRGVLAVNGDDGYPYAIPVNYLYDDKALERYRKRHKGPFHLQRYKGLGEMDAQQLWETTLDPETRMLKLVEIEDARMASEVTEMLMGTEVPPRRAFIYRNATDAELDI